LTQDENEVLVEVHSTSVNHLDVQLRNGAACGEAGGKPLSLPAVLGMDLSGIVRKVGSAVRNLREGDNVFGRQSPERLAIGRGGACAEWCVVEAADIARKPPNLTHEQAAAVPTAALTACAALRLAGLPDAAPASKESPPRVVVCGASGGVGTMAVQLAKQRGAFVLACCSAGNVDLVRSLGADAVVRRPRTSTMTSDDARELARATAMARALVNF
jgi:NADPH:quinone reductase-like Zn-dependent oxidoreductase